MLPNPQSLQQIPGIGKKMEADLIKLGVNTVNDLKGENPEQLYDKLCKKVGTKIDRCVLYVFRCAVYFAETKNPEPELLKWWNWKDKKEGK